MATGKSCDWTGRPAFGADAGETGGLGGGCPRRSRRREGPPEVGRAVAATTAPSTRVTLAMSERGTSAGIAGPTHRTARIIATAIVAGVRARPNHNECGTP